MIVYTITVHGRVMGVGFREFVKKTAKQLSIVGTVRNNYSSHVVEIACSGKKESIDLFIKTLWKGNFLSDVEDVKIYHYARKPSDSIDFESFNIID